MNFGDAFNAISITSAAMRLPHWNPDVLIRVQHPDGNSKMTAPYLYVESRNGLVHWRETNIELFSKDWVVVE